MNVNINGKDVLMPLISAFLVAAIAWIFYPQQISAINKYGLAYYSSCKLSGGEKTLIIHENQDIEESGGPGKLIRLNGGLGTVGCSSTATSTSLGLTLVATGYTFYTESGEAVTVGKVGSSAIEFTGITATDKLGIAGTWVKPLPITDQFIGISVTIIQFLGIIILLAFVGGAWGNIALDWTQGKNESLGQALGPRIVQLLVLLAMAVIAPVYLGFANDASLTNMGQYIVTQDYGNDLGDLLFGIVPVLVTLAIMAIASRDVMRLRSRWRGGERFNFGGAM